MPDAEAADVPRRVDHTFLLGVLTLGVSIGCRAPRPAPIPYESEVIVTSEPGEPVQGVVLSHEGTRVGTTNEQGESSLSLLGTEGESFLVDVRCPENLRSPAKPLAIQLRRLNGTRTRPRFEVTCPARTRTLLVAVRADNGPHVPIRRFGRELARTDASGAALVGLEVAPDESVDLTLDTSQSPWLKPRDPTQRFQIEDSDGLFTFNQTFEGGPRANHRRRAHSGPIRIDAR